MSTTTQNETHAVCDERLAHEGGKATCCYCRPHSGCTLGNKKTNTPKPIHEYKDRVPNFGKALEKEYPPVEATTTQNDWDGELYKVACHIHAESMAYKVGMAGADDPEMGIYKRLKTLLADARREVIAGLDERIEKLAELEHEQWWKWARTLTEKETLSKERVERWQKDMVPYTNLSEDVKEYDRKWARKVLATLKEENIINSIE